MISVRDAVVIGSGLVGLAAAVALARAGLEVTLIGSEERPPDGSGSWDQRIYAISPGSGELLQSLGVWERLRQDRLQAVRTMDIRGDALGSRLEFQAIDSGVEALAWIVESSNLASALWQALDDEPAVDLVIPGRPSRLSVDGEAVTVDVEGNAPVRARLAIGADGASSWVRRTAGLRVSSRAYPQTAIVANFRISGDHGATARQWFRPDGILALLPLPGGVVSMVWSVNTDAASRLLALAPDELEASLEIASGRALGSFSLVTPPATFPLRLLDCPTPVGERLVLVGDAAHNVHPLAGQGMNLGLRDVRDLARVLTERGAERDCGNRVLLRRHARARREDVLATMAVTDGLQHLFSSRVPAVEWLRNAGLSLTGRLPMIRRALARHALA
ncbi:MAG: FAD-dependent oxidoreductase [Betaproteobacteria bacterium]